MKTGTILVVLSLAIANSAQGGGFLADSFVKPFDSGTADRLDKAHEAMGRPLDRAITSGSSTCVTPRVICDAGDTALKGTACYCNPDGEKVFGRIQ
jgi:hypothetical protein